MDIKETYLDTGTNTDPNNDPNANIMPPDPLSKDLAAKKKSKGRGRVKGTKNRSHEELALEAEAKAKFLPHRKISPQQEGWLKRRVLELIETRQAKNLSQAGRILNIPKLQLYALKRHDKEWAEAISMCDELLADELEEELQELFVNGKLISMPIITARIFMLKALRPKKFRDNAKPIDENNQLVSLLGELKRLGRPQAQNVQAVQVKIESSEPTRVEVSGVGNIQKQLKEAESVQDALP